MMNMRINATKRTIEMTKKFAATASHYGTDEYKMLQEVRHDYPGYSVQIINRKSVQSTFKGLTYEYMEMYIEKHDNENGSIMKEYNMLRAKDGDSIEIGAESESYMTIKAWFLDQFPAFAEYHEKRNEMTENIKKKVTATNEAKRKAALAAKRALLHVRFS